jgi:hypothetical protein
MDRKKESHTGVPYKELLFVASTSLASGRYTCTSYYVQYMPANDRRPSVLTLHADADMLLHLHYLFIDPGSMYASCESERPRTMVLYILSFYCKSLVGFAYSRYIYQLL